VTGFVGRSRGYPLVMSDAPPEDRERPIEVEVERLPEGQDPAGPSGVAGGRGGVGRAAAVGRELGPVVAGLSIDLVDLLTPFPILGLLVGTLAGFVLARNAGATPGAARWLALLVGAYCALPITGRFPVATLVGLFVKLGRLLRTPS